MNESLLIPQYKNILTVNITNTFEFPNSLGDFESNGNIEHDYFESVEDGNPVIRTYNNFTINEGHTVTTSNRCKGLYLNILGDLTVNGTLSMTARGAKAAGNYVGIDKDECIIYYSDENVYPNNFQIIYPVGGIGIGTETYKYSDGANGINGACGSGGNAYYKGGNGTSFSGGAGAGGFAHNFNGGKLIGGMTAGEENGGSGGIGGTGQGGCRGGGGAGNPGGEGGKPDYYPDCKLSESGTGGLMILFVTGTIIINNNGNIQSNGCNGGDSHTAWGNHWHQSQPGAGSGGGAIHIFYKKNIINVNNIIANGGHEGARIDNAIPGTCNGGNGTINLVKI